MYFKPVHTVKIIYLVKIEAIDEGELTVEFTESDTETIDTQNATALPNISFDRGEASNTGKFTFSIDIGHSDYWNKKIHGIFMVSEVKMNLVRCF